MQNKIISTDISSRNEGITKKKKKSIHDRNILSLNFDSILNNGILITDFSFKFLDIFAIPTYAQIGCAAALLCVEEQFCTIDGTISSEPVTLSEKEILRRVPTSVSKDKNKS